MVYNVPSDGSCCFHSFSLALNGNFSQSQYYRKVICAYVVNHSNRFKSTVHACHNANMTIRYYIQTMLNWNVWATALELQIAASVLGLKISVWLKYGNRFTKVTFAHPATTRSITLLLSQQHFQLLQEVFTKQAQNNNTTEHHKHTNNQQSQSRRPTSPPTSSHHSIFRGTVGSNFTPRQTSPPTSSHHSTVRQTANPNFS